MNRYQRIILILGAFFLVVPFITTCSDQKLDRKQIYELQDKCSKRAEEVFKKEYPSTSWQDNDGTINHAEFRCHYNLKHNKCFMLTETHLIMAKGKKEIYNITQSLHDANENKMYGSITQLDQKPPRCRMMEKMCKNWDEWDALIKPYMEE